MALGLRGLHASVRPYAEYAHQVARYYGIEPVVTSTYRPWAEQKRLRERWEAGKSEFPANRPGDSAHNYGLAWDSWVPEEDRPAWRAIREWVGFHVPGNDWVHAAVPNWRQYRR
jgi:hypothetical protein